MHKCHKTSSINDLRLVIINQLIVLPLDEMHIQDLIQKTTYKRSLIPIRIYKNSLMFKNLGSLRNIPVFESKADFTSNWLEMQYVIEYKYINWKSYIDIQAYYWQTLVLCSNGMFANVYQF